MADDKTPDTAAVDDAQEAADFGAGFAGVADTKIPDRSDKADTKPAANGKAAPPETPRAEAEPPPEVVQITKKEWDDIRAAVVASASHDQQIRKAFGNIGNLTRLLNEQKEQAPPAGRKIEINRAAFAEMEKDFPELAAHTRAALEAALSGLPVNGASEADPAKLESMMATYTAKREIEALEDAYPEWRKIVGAVDIANEQPDPNNAFRRWLGTKDVAYQTRINGSESAAVIGRAIRLFQRETATAPARSNGGTPRDTARADRIRAAVQPRGDNAGAPAGRSEDDEFEAGYRSARN